MRLWVVPVVWRWIGGSYATENGRSRLSSSVVYDHSLNVFSVPCICTREERIKSLRRSRGLDPLWCCTWAGATMIETAQCASRTDERLKVAVASPAAQLGVRTYVRTNDEPGELPHPPVCRLYASPSPVRAPTMHHHHLALTKSIAPPPLRQEYLSANLLNTAFVSSSTGR